MSEALTYDVMGNIASLNRDGAGAKVYNYYNSGSSNRLQSVSGVTIQNYEYDANGNATKDGLSGISLTYNYLNLPATAVRTTGTTVNLSYTYDVTGNKLAKNSSGTVRNYVDGIEYKPDGTTIDIIHTEEGVAQNNGSGTYTYHYNLSDHLGNVRYTFDVVNGIVSPLQKDDYYAFGKRKTSMLGSADNKYLYNGKELQEELGQYDYGARFYDPVIGRWNVVDALADEDEQIDLSPYQYAWNNPIKLIDPDGNCPNCLIGGRVGALFGAVMEGGSQLIKSGKITSWRAVGGAALQGAITGAVAGATGGASLLVSASAGTAANIVGGAVNRAVQGKNTTTKDVIVDGLVGAGAAVVGKVAEKAINKLSNQAKGVLGETITEVKYGAQGYKSVGKATVGTGGRTATGRAQVAKYDHDMVNVFTGKKLTVESKFNTSGLTSNQSAAQSNVTTAGGLIVDRTTSGQLGGVVQGGVTTVVNQTNKPRN